MNECPRSGHLPPAAVLLHLPVCGEGPRDHRAHHQRPRAVLAVVRAREKREREIGTVCLTLVYVCMYVCMQDQRGEASALLERAGRSAGALQGRTARAGINNQPNLT